MISKIEEITKQLIKEIGEDPNREGLIKTPHRVSKNPQKRVVNEYKK